MGSAIPLLHEFGQSPWYDNLSRALVREGGLARLVEDDGIRGVTSNPTILDKAIAAGEGYDEQLVQCARDGASIEATYWTIVLDDIATIGDAEERVVSLVVGACREIALVCRDNRQAPRIGKFKELRLDIGLFGKSVWPTRREIKAKDL